MKKVLAFLLTVVLVVSASVCVAFAASSPEAQGVISGVTATDANDKEALIKFEKIDGKVNKNFYNTLQGLKDEEKDSTLKVVGHFEVEVDGKPEYPLTVTLDVLGISKSSKVFVMLQKGKETVAVEPTVKDGKVVFELDEKYDKMALVTDGKTATKVEKENDVLSPQTFDATIYVMMIAVMAMAVIFVTKKVKA
ncbi:MAG: hypothetical protein E7542_01925 [Ruminococcaceae bacterium]|nr:hypothetical protein [Oscillospiraceae bacterium]